MFSVTWLPAQHLEPGYEPWQPTPQLHHLTLNTSVRTLATLPELATCPCNCCQGRSSLQTSWEEAALARGCLPKSKAALLNTCKTRQHVAHQIAARGPVWAIIYRNRLCAIQPYFAAWVRHIWPLSQQDHMRDGHMHAMHDGSKCYSAVSPSISPWQGLYKINTHRRCRSTDITCTYNCQNCRSSISNRLYCYSIRPKRSA